MRRKEERKRSIHGDNTNVLTKEFKTFTVKRFGEQVSLLIIGVNKLKSENTIFDKLPNEVMSNLYVFSSRMLNRILRDVDSTGIVIVDGKMFLTNTITVKLLFTTLCFVGLYSVPNLIVMFFNLLYPVCIMGFHCKGCVLERERV